MASDDIARIFIEGRKDRKMKITEKVLGTWLLEIPASMIWTDGDPIERDQETIVFKHDTLESAQLQERYYANFNSSNNRTSVNSATNNSI